MALHECFRNWQENKELKLQKKFYNFGIDAEGFSNKNPVLFIMQKPWLNNFATFREKLDI